MRVSIRKGHRSDISVQSAIKCNVYFNGQLLQRCVEADDSEGYVVVLGDKRDNGWEEIEMRGTVRLECE